MTEIVTVVVTGHAAETAIAVSTETAVAREIAAAVRNEIEATAVATTRIGVTDTTDALGTCRSQCQRRC